MAYWSAVDAVRIVTPSLISATFAVSALLPATPLWQLSRMITLFFAGSVGEGHDLEQGDAVVPGFTVAGAQEAAGVLDVAVAGEVEQRDLGVACEELPTASSARFDLRRRRVRSRSGGSVLGS